MVQTDIVTQRAGLRQLTLDQFWRAHGILGASEEHMLSGDHATALRCLDDLNEEVKRLRRSLKALED